MTLKRMMLGVVTSAALLPAAWAQGPVPATIHGHVNDETGQPIKNSEVKLTQDLGTEADKRKYVYTFKVDDAGNYKGEGIAPGAYLINLFSGTVSIDFLENQTLKAGTDTLENFDLSRPEFMAKVTPERKKQIEEFRAKNASVMNVNKVINNLNATLNAVRLDLATAKPNFDKDATDMQQGITAKPDEAILYYTLGAVLTGAADAGAADDKAQHKSVQSDDVVMKKYQDSIDAYKKGIELTEAAIAAKKKANPTDAAVGWNSIGNAEAKLGKIPDAQAAYDNAVKLNPAGSAMYYGNAAAVLFNANQAEAAAAEADKAIAADPTKPDPYFIKGQYLIQKASVDKTGKIVAPPGCVEAYQKYLELDPDGKSAATVKEILAGMGEKVTTKYRAGKK